MDRIDSESAPWAARPGSSARDGRWVWPTGAGAEGAEFSGVPEFVPGTLQEQTDAYVVYPSIGAEDGRVAGPVEVLGDSAGDGLQEPAGIFNPAADEHPDAPLIGGTGNLRHILGTGLPPGVELADVHDPGSKARAAVMDAAREAQSRDARQPRATAPPPADRH